MVMDPLFIFIVGAIIVLLCIGIIGNWQLASRIRALKQQVVQFASRESDWEQGAPGYDAVAEIIREYKTQRLAGIEQVNTQALIERYYNQVSIRVLGIFPMSAGAWERFVPFLNASMVMLGLLGTFIGLTYSLFGMQSILAGFGSESELSISNIVSAISQPFDGMSIAFITSICGIGASLLLSLFTSGLLGTRIGPNTNQLRNELLTECEDFLDNRYLVYVEMQKPKGSMDELLERLAFKIKESFDKSVVAFGDAIVTTTKKIDESVLGVNAMVEKQHKIIALYDNGATQLAKFGVSMENTVQTLVDNHKDTAAQMEHLGLQVERLNESITTLGEKTIDSSRSLESMIRTSNQMLEDERKNSEKVVQLFGERWNQVAKAQKSLIDTIANIQRQMEETVRNTVAQAQQFGSELNTRTREQWEGMRREWQSQAEQASRKEQEIQQQLIRQIEQLFTKIDATLQQNNRSILQNLEQTYTELGRAIRQLEETGQKNIESHRFLIERLPVLSRSAEEFSRTIENLDRQQADFLERFRREVSTLLSQSQERERKGYPSSDNMREIRELVRELEGVRVLLEREFRQSHQFTSEIALLVEAIYETGKSTIRRSDQQLIDGRGYSNIRAERYENGRVREEGYRR